MSAEPLGNDKELVNAEPLGSEKEPVSAEPPGNDEEPPLPPPDYRPRREALDAELPLPPLPSKKNRSNKEPVSAEPLEEPEKSAPLGKETKNVHQRHCG